MRPLLLLLTLEAFYLTLSGQFHNRFLMIAGLVCSVGVTVLAGRMRVIDDEGVPARFWLRTALYVPWLLWQVVLSNIDVAKRVWRRELPIAPRLITIPHSLETGYGIATYANSITLTPGTVTIEAGDHEFLVHCLSHEFADDLLGDEMHRRCRKVEGQSV